MIDKEKLKIRKKKFSLKYPWLSSFYNARKRCQKGKKGSTYAKRGIRFLMTKDDFKYLWFRDKAYLLKEPSIHRINCKDHYRLDNYKFIELVLNNKLDRNRRPVNQYTQEGKFVKRFKSLSDAVRSFQRNDVSFISGRTSRIITAIRRNWLALGYRWKYSDKIIAEGKE